MNYFAGILTFFALTLMISPPSCNGQFSEEFQARMRKQLIGYLCEVKGGEVDVRPAACTCQDGKQVKVPKEGFQPLNLPCSSGAPASCTCSNGVQFKPPSSRAEMFDLISSLADYVNYDDDANRALPNNPSITSMLGAFIVLLVAAFVPNQM